MNMFSLKHIPQEEHFTSVPPDKIQKSQPCKTVLALTTVTIALFCFGLVFSVFRYLELGENR